MTQLGSIRERVPAFAKPGIDAVLTRKDWDKKKGVFAKLVKGKTGIGEQCDAVNKAHKDTQWDVLDLHTVLMNNGFDNWRNDDFNSRNLKKHCDAAFKEVQSGSARKYFRALEDLADLCTKTEKSFRQNKKIPKASADHCKTMAAKATVAAGAINTNTYGAYVAKVNDAVHGWIKEAVVANLVSTTKTGEATVAKGLAAVRNDPTPGSLSAFSTGTVRSINQALGNIAKVEGRFGTADPSSYLKGFKQLEPYARGSIPGAPDDPMAILQFVSDEIEPRLNTAIDLLKAWKPPKQFR